MVLTDTRWTEESWRHCGNKRQKEEERVRKRWRLRLRIAVQPQASTIGRPCLLFFTLLLCQPAVVWHFSLLSFSITISSRFYRFQGRLCHIRADSPAKQTAALGDLWKKLRSQPTPGRYSPNCHVQCSAVNVDSSNRGSNSINTG